MSRFPLYLRCALPGEDDTLAKGAITLCCRRLATRTWNDILRSAMKSYYSDTHPKIEALQIEFIRRMPSWKKIAIVNGLNETIKTFAVSGIKERYPNATPQEIHQMLAELMLGEELARKVYAHAR